MRTLRLCILPALLTRSAGATPVEPTDRSAAPVATDPQIQTYRVEVVFVGRTADSPDLVALVEELLAARGGSVTRHTQGSMSEAEWLESGEPSDRKSARAWITLPTSNLARIWFAILSERRYLWRELRLENGLDPLGCEQIAQVVQTSTEALSRGAVGHSSLEARRAWQEQESYDLRSGRASRIPENRVDIRDGRVVVRAVAKARWQPHVGIGYAVAWTGSELEWLHGPVAEVGLDRLSSGGALGLHLAAERHFSQSFENELAALQLQSTMGWLLLHWRDTSTLKVHPTGRFGFGTELTNVQPGAPDASPFVPKSAYKDLSYWLRLRVGATGQLGPLHWDVSGGLDLSLSRTSYDFKKDQSTERLVHPWPVRPGVELGISWR